MVTGWRRAFCTSIPHDPETTVLEKHQSSPTPSPSFKSCTKLAFLSGGGNPSTPRLQSQPVSSPRLRCRTTIATVPTPSSQDTPRLQCKTTKTPKLYQGSRTLSPKSPSSSRFSLFKTSLGLSKSSCGICLQSVKTGQGTAIFTAECSHAFHFPCIAAHVRKHGSLVCPVCSVSWRDVPSLAFNKSRQPPPKEDENEAALQEYNNREKKDETKRVSWSLRDVKTKNEHHNQQSKNPSDVRVYDDDEPLVSSTAGGPFNPIPEADENSEEAEEESENEEFQGFFVNPNPIKTTTDDVVIHANNARDLRNIEIRLLPEAAVLSVSHTHETFAVAVKVKAPRPASRNGATTAPILDPSRRAPIDLVTVLDLSESMTGAKLQMLKRAMRLVISSLGSTDRLSIVAFSEHTKRLLPLKRMTAHGQRLARLIIDRLVCSSQGSSVVGDALRKAAKVLEDRREKNPVASVMLLSDGQNERVGGIHTNSNNRRSRSTHVSSTARFCHLEIPVHAFGYGENGGSGHSREPSVEDAFAKCVGGLLSVVVQDFRIQLGFASGSLPAEVSAVYSCTGRPTVLGSGSIRLGDLYAEEERELLLEMKVPAAAVVESGTHSHGHHVMAVRYCFKDPITQEIVYGKEQAFLVPRPQAVRSSEPKIERLRNFFVTTRAIAEARRLSENNELSSANHLLSTARALLLQSSSISAGEYIRSLEAELAEVAYRRQQQQIQRRRVVTEREQAWELDQGVEVLTPTSAWRAAERLAKLAMMRKSMNQISDLHGFENARF